MAQTHPYRKWLVEKMRRLNRLEGPALNILLKASELALKSEKRLYLVISKCSDLVIVEGPAGSCHMEIVNGDWWIEYHKPPHYYGISVEEETPENLARHLCGE
jgi:hypothetical protein